MTKIAICLILSLLLFGCNDDTVSSEVVGTGTVYIFTANREDVFHNAINKMMSENPGLRVVAIKELSTGNGVYKYLVVIESVSENNLAATRPIQIEK